MIPTIANIRKAIYCLNKRIDILEKNGGSGGVSSEVIELQNKVTALESIISEGENPTAAIDKFNEIVAFLNSIQNTDTLSGLLLDIISLIPDALIQSDWNQTNNKSVDFIKNKPTIPAAQILSDWNQSDNSQLDFIKNKPSIIERSEMGEANGVATLDEDGHLEAEQLEGDYPNSVSGNVVGEFSDSSEVSFRPTAGAVDVNSGKAGKGAKLMSVKGNTVAWNMLTKNASLRIRNVWFYITNGHITANGTLNYASGNLGTYILPSGHKIYISAKNYNSSNSNFCLRFNGWGVSISSNMSTIVNATSAVNYLIPYGGAGEELVLSLDLFVIDLTLIYGAGNEPTTVEQFEADYLRWFGKPLSYEEYDKGSLRPVLMQSVKTTGFNQWDEEWEEGFYDSATGQKKSASYALSYIRNKAFIKAFENMLYYIKAPSGHGVWVGCYDGNGAYIGNVSVSSALFTTIAGTRFVNFYIVSYGTTYNHDVCINLSHSGARDGEYEPYWTSMLNVPVTTLKGKLNGEGSSVVVFPGGMKKAETVYDEIVRRGDKTYAIKRIGSVDLGDLGWVSADYYQTGGGASYISYVAAPSNAKPGVYHKKANIIASKGVNTESTNLQSRTWEQDNYYITNVRNIEWFFDVAKTAQEVISYLNGVILYYELATPEEYLLDDFELPQDYDVDDYGTEEVQLGTNGCAPILDLKYGINAGDTIKNLPHNYVSAVGEQSFTEAQKARARKNIGAVSEEELESKGFAKIWRGTLAEYNLILTPDDNTIYIITPDLP